MNSNPEKNHKHDTLDPIPGLGKEFREKESMKSEKAKGWDGFKAFLLVCFFIMTEDGSRSRVLLNTNKYIKEAETVTTYKPFIFFSFAISFLYRQIVESGVMTTINK